MLRASMHGTKTWGHSQQNKMLVGCSFYKIYPLKKCYIKTLKRWNAVFSKGLGRFNNSFLILRRVFVLFPGKKPNEMVSVKKVKPDR